LVSLRDRRNLGRFFTWTLVSFVQTNALL